MTQPRTPPPRRQPIGPLGLLLVLVALTMQMAAAGVVPLAAMAGGVERLAAASICHADSGADGQGGAPVHHRMPDCAVCPLCQAIAHAGVLLAPPWAGVSAPVAVALLPFTIPPGRAPPGRVATAASARGPPVAA